MCSLMRYYGIDAYYFHYSVIVASIKCFETQYMK